MLTLTLFATHPPTFQEFLERNIITRDILCSPYCQSIAKILLQYAKKISEEPITKQSEIGQFIRKIQTGEKIFEFTQNVTKFAIFDRLFDPISIALIQEHLNYDVLVSDTDEITPNNDTTMPVELTPIIERHQSSYTEALRTHLIKAPILLRNHVVIYNYPDRKLPILDHEDVMLNLEQRLKDIGMGTELDFLLLSGGHGSEIFLNNLSTRSIDEMVNLFKKYNIKTNAIAIDCCFGAFHINALTPLLTRNGIIIANYAESNEQTVLQAFQGKFSKSEFIEKIKTSTSYNVHMVIYDNNMLTVSGTKISLKPLTTDSIYNSDKMRKFSIYLKSSGLVYKPITLAGWSALAMGDTFGFFSHKLKEGLSKKSAGYERSQP